MSKHKVVHFEIPLSDLKTKEFYVKVFGWKTPDWGEEYVGAITTEADKDGIGGMNGTLICLLVYSRRLLEKTNKRVNEKQCLRLILAKKPCSLYSLPTYGIPPPEFHPSTDGR